MITISDSKAMKQQLAGLYRKPAATTGETLVMLAAAFCIGFGAALLIVLHFVPAY